MDQWDLECIADSAYAEAGLDAHQPHVPRMARSLLGPDAILRGASPLHGPAALVRVSDAWRIVICPSLSPLDAHVACAHELGHWLLRRHGCCPLDHAEEEDLADRLAGALMAPRDAFRGMRHHVGPDFVALARAFGMTETGVALRTGEVLRVPIAVVSPYRVRVRGPEDWAWPDERTIRAWAANHVPGIKKTRLSDDPRRVVLDPAGLAQ